MATPPKDTKPPTPRPTPRPVTKQEPARRPTPPKGTASPTPRPSSPKTTKPEPSPRPSSPRTTKPEPSPRPSSPRTAKPEPASRRGLGLDAPPGGVALTYGDASRNAQAGGRRYTPGVVRPGTTADPALVAAARAAARRAGLPEDGFLALIEQESSWNPTAGSQAGAYGLGQLMPGTAAELGVDPRDVNANLDGAARYLAARYAQFGDWERALAGYNAGPGAVERYGGVPPFAETRDYVAALTPFFQGAPAGSPDALDSIPAPGLQFASPDSLEASVATVEPRPDPSGFSPYTGSIDITGATAGLQPGIRSMLQRAYGPLVGPEGRVEVSTGVSSHSGNHIGGHAADHVGVTGDGSRILYDTTDPRAMIAAGLARAAGADGGIGYGPDYMGGRYAHYDQDGPRGYRYWSDDDRTASDTGPGAVGDMAFIDRLGGMDYDTALAAISGQKPTMFAGGEGMAGATTAIGADGVPYVIASPTKRAPAPIGTTYGVPARPTLGWDVAPPGVAGVAHPPSLPIGADARTPRVPAAAVAVDTTDTGGAPPLDRAPTMITEGVAGLRRGLEGLGGRIMDDVRTMGDGFGNFIRNFGRGNEHDPWAALRDRNRRGDRRGDRDEDEAPVQPAPPGTGLPDAPPPWWPPGWPWPPGDAVVPPGSPPTGGTTPTPYYHSYPDLSLSAGYGGYSGYRPILHGATGPNSGYGPDQFYGMYDPRKRGLGGI